MDQWNSLLEMIKTQISSYVISKVIEFMKSKHNIDIDSTELSSFIFPSSASVISTPGLILPSTSEAYTWPTPVSISSLPAPVSTLTPSVPVVYNPPSISKRRTAPLPVEQGCMHIVTPRMGPKHYCGIKRFIYKGYDTTFCIKCITSIQGVQRELTTKLQSEGSQFTLSEIFAAAIESKGSYKPSPRGPSVGYPTVIPGLPGLPGLPMIQPYVPSTYVSLPVSAPQIPLSQEYELLNIGDMYIITLNKKIVGKLNPTLDPISFQKRGVVITDIVQLSKEESDILNSSVESLKEAGYTL